MFYKKLSLNCKLLKNKINIAEKMQKMFYKELSLNCKLLKNKSFQSLFQFYHRKKVFLDFPIRNIIFMHALFAIY